LIVCMQIGDFSTSDESRGLDCRLGPPPFARAHDGPLMTTTSRRSSFPGRMSRKHRVRLSVELLEGRIAMATLAGNPGASSLRGPEIVQSMAYIEPGVKLENSVKITYGETAYLRAKLMGRDAPLAGRTILFTYGLEPNLFVFGEAVTDAEGVATYALTPDQYRVGNNFYGEYGFVRAIFEGDAQQTSSTSQSEKVYIDPAPLYVTAVNT
jgi:hypothetical protein